MYSIYEKIFSITDNMCDKNQVIKPSGVLDILQSIAGEHADLLHIGYNNIIQKNLAFVIARVKYNLLKPIKRYKSIRVVTWPCLASRIEMKRDYEFYDLESGELLLKASSIWILIDINTRKICRSNSVCYPTNIYPKENYIEFDKLKFDGIDFNESHKYDVRLCDLDLNNHMNNTKYPDTILLEKPCSFCQIDYVHEAKLNDVLDIKIKKEEDYLNALGECNNQISFKAKFEFYKGEI